jgi:hypothetical protein
MKKLTVGALFVLATSVLGFSKGHLYWSEAGSDFSLGERNAANGCYARLHMDKSHDFAILNMVGNSAIYDIDAALGADIEHDINMIEVGANAKVTLYDNEGLRDFRGDISADSFFDDHRYLDRVDSLKVTCLK